MHEDQSHHEPDAQAKSKVPFSQNVHTNGGAHVAGNVSVKRGDFIGRDKVVSIFVSPPGRITLFLLLIVLVGIVASSLILLQRQTRCDSPAGWVKYTVRQGDTVWNLASSYGVSPSALKIHNCLTSNSLNPGQVIFVPPEVGGQVCGTAPRDWVQVTVGPSITLHYLSFGYGVTPYELAYVNCLDQFIIHEGQTILVPPRPFDVVARLSALEPKGILTYTVQPGDTNEGIAAFFGLQPETIMWANPAIEDAPDYLRIGQEIVVPPVDGVIHTATEGETVESIAAQYQVEARAITKSPYNKFRGPGSVLIPGQHLIVPGGTKAYRPRTIAVYTGIIPMSAQGTVRFQWPALGAITQGYWWGHRALDIASSTGTAVRASDRGFVIYAGRTDIGYGNLIVIDHVDGFKTYYAHLDKISVAVGDIVDKGQRIGDMGSTGEATGPNLHFELRRDDVPVNPRAYLP